MSVTDTKQLDTREKIRYGRIFLWTGLLVGIFCIALSLFPDNPLTRIGPDWFKRLNQDPSINLLGLIPSVILVLIGSLLLHDGKPIPDEYIQPPNVPVIPADEPWRQPTGFRYLEKLKRECTSIEKSMRESYAEALSAHRKLPSRSGYIEYKRLKNTVLNNVRKTTSLEETAIGLREHISKVFAGDVRADVLELEEAADKLRLKKQHKENDLRELAEKLRSAEKETRHWIEDERIDTRDSIKHIELSLVEIESCLRELREFDFEKLYRELGLSSESMRARKEELDEIKKKADIISEIKPQVSRGSKSEDERKMDAAAQRIKHDITFDVEQRLGRKLTTLEAIQTFQKARAEAIKNEASLSYDEKTERLDQLRVDCEEYKRSLKNEVNIYEDD